MKILACDLGGTKTYLQLSQWQNGAYQILAEQRYLNQPYRKFDDLLQHFMSLANVSAGELVSITACFAIAGPIQGETIQVTNLPWILDRKQLQYTFPFRSLSLINDFSAIAWALDDVDQRDCCVINPGTPQQGCPQVVVGAGTGLGVAWKVDGMVYPSEGGHSLFSPATESQHRLLQFLQRTIRRVSFEDLLSGPGLVNIARFTTYRSATKAGYADLVTAIGKEDPSLITALADAGNPLARDALHLFISVYANKAQELALNFLPYSGLYIAGGIAGKIVSYFQSGNFCQSFFDAEPMTPLLRTIPVILLTDPQIGLKGARYKARIAANNC